MTLKMARMKLVARIAADERRRMMQQQPGLSRAPPRRRRAPGTGVKNIEGRVRNKTFKIKKLIAVPKNLEVKKNGQVVRRMTVRRRAIFPGERGDQY